MNRLQRDWLLFIVAIGFFAVLGCLMFIKVPTENKEMLQMLLMPLSGAFGFLVGAKPTTPETPQIKSSGLKF